MFEFLRARSFRLKVLRHIEQQMLLHLGREDGGEAVGAFATAAHKSDIGPFFLERLRRSGLTATDAATAYFDAAITSIIRVLPQNADDDLKRLLGNMEAGLDRMFLGNPGMVVPRNGKAGPSLAEFTDESGH
ncbi:hypothetical protein [Sphingomonas bacterium]|uniref:hypothetical protein n=1 Tax=Sphingomonas bacterium TaxID=1895847 RepID=UPI001576C5A4|nr:hypothetical protein [Sphingomonas bacterium]